MLQDRFDQIKQPSSLIEAEFTISIKDMTHAISVSLMRLVMIVLVVLRQEGFLRSVKASGCRWV